MLTISRPLSASQAQTYHAEAFTSARQEYYADGDLIHGHWHGTLAAHCHLSGPVNPEHFARLAEGQNPWTGAQLIRHVAPHTYTNAKGERVSVMGHRAGWDATFSAPKSVSLAALVGGDERIRVAHREAVATALDALEAYTQARLGGVKMPETTGRFVAAVFEHDSSRPVDGYSAPQLHSHAVIFNMTETSHERMRSVQVRELFRSQPYASAVYRAELARRLVALGYQIDVGRHGQPELRGFSAEYLEAASPRRAQILAALEAGGRSGAGAAQIAAHQTRESKIPHGKADVQAQHQAMARAFGDQPRKAVHAAKRRVNYSKSIPNPSHARDALTYAKDRNMERSAVVDERHVLTDALKRGICQVSLGDVAAEFRRRVDAGEFLSRAPRLGHAGRCWTTPEMVGLERATIERLWEGRERCQPIQRDFSVTALSAEQRQAVAAVLTSRDQVLALDGIAGSGKTTALRAIAGAAARRYEVLGVAPTGRAALVLAAAGIQTSTVQRHLAAGPVPDRARLTIVDESSLVSTRMMADLLDRQRPQDRMLLVGDVRQHQSVDAGRSFDQLQEAGMQTAKLTTIVRQTDPALRAMVERLAFGQVAHAISDLTAAGKVTVIPNRTERLAAVASAVLAEPKTLVVCPDHKSREEINAAVHAARGTTGKTTRVLVARHDLTGTDRAYADRYEVGDVVRYTSGSKAHGLSAGEYATVIARDRASNKVTVQREAGQFVAYDPKRLRGVAVYQEQERAFAVGDRVQFTAPEKALKVANRQLGTIRSLSPLRIALDSGRNVTLQGTAASHHLDYGWAVTSHSAQGQTADRVLLHLDSGRASESIVNARLAYVALSRGQHDARIICDNAAQLIHALSRDVSHRAAIEPTPTREQARAV